MITASEARLIAIQKPEHKLEVKKLLAKAYQEIRKKAKLHEHSCHLRTTDYVRKVHFEACSVLKTIGYKINDHVSGYGLPYETWIWIYW